MAATNTRLYGGTLTASATNLYTVPTAKRAIVKTVSLCNRTANAVTATLKLGSQYFLYAYPMDPNDTIVLSPMDHVLAAGEIINGNASAATSLDIIVSGRVEDV